MQRATTIIPISEARSVNIATDDDEIMMTNWILTEWSLTSDGTLSPGINVYKRLFSYDSDYKIQRRLF